MIFCVAYGENIKFVQFALAWNNCGIYTGEFKIPCQRADVALDGAQEEASAAWLGHKDKSGNQ